jgi:hypothetical protein
VKRVLHSLKISEISAVDRPAQTPARAVIMKREGPPSGGPSNGSDVHNMTRSDILKSLAKDYGAVKIAKSIIADGNGPNGVALSEADFTEIVKASAMEERRSTTETPEQAFARVFTAHTADGLAIRKAHQIVKNFPSMMRTEPVQVGGAAAQAVDDPVDALAQLQKLAEEQRKRSPTLTIEQAFARVYSAPENASLAAAERSQNRPRATTSNHGA